MSDIMYPDMIKPIYPLRDDIFIDLDEIDFMNLIHRYYMGETVKILLKEYGLKVSDQKFITNLPYFEDKSSECPYCNEPMFAKGSRSKKNGGVYVDNIRTCYSCDHTIGNRKCYCYNCQDHFQQILDKDIFESKQRAYTNSDYTMASPKTKLAIAAILRSGQDEHDITLIRPNFLHIKTKLSPTSSMSKELISYLYDKQWIYFDDENKESCFGIERDKIISFRTFETQFRLNVTDEFTLFSELNSPDFSDFDFSDMLMLWKNIATEECLEYLEYNLAEYNLIENTGPKTITVIQEVLNHFSISQTFMFIWGAVKDAAAYYQKDRVTKKHAVNSIPGSIQKRLDKALVEGKEVKGFRRNYNLPQSIYADLIFNKVLKLGDRAFDIKIDVESLP